MKGIPPAFQEPLLSIYKAFGNNPFTYQDCLRISRLSKQQFFKFTARGILMKAKKSKSTDIQRWILSEISNQYCKSQIVLLTHEAVSCR